MNRREFLFDSFAALGAGALMGLLGGDAFSETAASGGAPKAVRYDRPGDRRGYADGSVVITPPDDAAEITGYLLYWGNKKGVLDGYTPIVVPPGGASPAVFRLHSGTYIPHGATKLLAYCVRGKALSAAAAEAPLSKGEDISLERPLYSFQVFSDTHITVDPNDDHAKHLDMAFKDIKANDSRSIGIFNVGDVSDGGAQIQFDNYEAIVKANAQGLPPLYYAIGNHDLRGNNGWRAQIERFNENFDESTPYFLKVIGRATFIFLGSQTTGDNGGDFANLYDDQLDWLKAQLASASKNAGPIFVFLHQPLMNTISGTLPGQGWSGVAQDAKLRAILDRYPQVVMFTGHTHWELDADHAMYDGGGKEASFFNDGAVGTLWTDAQTAKTGSQGLYVEVYTDRILVRGRDFVRGKWISNAQFMLDLTKNASASASGAASNENASNRAVAGMNLVRETSY